MILGEIVHKFRQHRAREGSKSCQDLLHHKLCSRHIVRNFLYWSHKPPTELVHVLLVHSGNTLASHLWDQSSNPSPTSCEKACSYLPLVGSLQYRILYVPYCMKLYVLVPSVIPTTHYSITNKYLNVLVVQLVWAWSTLYFGMGHLHWDKLLGRWSSSAFITTQNVTTSSNCSKPLPWAFHGPQSGSGSSLRWMELWVDPTLCKNVTLVHMQAWWLGSRACGCGIKSGLSLRSNKQHHFCFI